MYTNTRIFKNSLAEAIGMLKGFDVDYSSICDDKILIKHYNKAFVLKIEDITNVELTGEVRKKLLIGEYIKSDENKE